MCNMAMQHEITLADIIKQALFDHYVNRLAQAILNCDEQEARRIAEYVQGNYWEDWEFFLSAVHARLEGR